MNASKSSNRFRKTITRGFLSNFLRCSAAGWICLVAAGLVRAVVLDNSRLRAEIDDNTGALAALYDSDGTPLLTRSLDQYELQSAPGTRVVASESDDRVVWRMGSFSFVCENLKLPGIFITKQYTLDTAWLTKKVTFGTPLPDIGLLKYATGSNVASALYDGAYLNDPSRHPLDYPYLFTRDLKTERRVSDSNSAADHYLVVCTNPQRGRGLAQYRSKVNNQFVLPLSSYAYEPSLFYGPAGWRMGCAAAWLSTGRAPLSCEVRWHAFRGDHVAFHREFLALPESQWDASAPAPVWLKKVQVIDGLFWTQDSFRNLSRYRKLAELLPDDGILLVMIGNVFSNTRDYMADPIASGTGIPIPAATLRKVVDDLHALSPKIKVGPITWQWGFDELDPIFKAHPEWTVHDGAGQPVFAATGWSEEKVYSQLLTPECREFVLGQFRQMVQRYDFDFTYMDSGQGGVTRFDWTTKRNAQDYDWANLYHGIRQAARGNRDGIAFFNGTPRLYSVGADCGFFEGVGIFPYRDWRALADRLFLVKLYQPGDRWTMPLYWTNERKQEYANYCLLLALKPEPGYFLGSDPPIQRWPIIAAANELADARLASEANPRPCWWQEATETECYALRMPGAGLLTALHHGNQPAKVTLSCDLAPLGLDLQKPTHVWLFEPQSVVESEAKVIVTEAEANAIFATEGKAPHRSVAARFIGTRPAGGARFAQEVDLQPNRTALLLLTQSPTLTYAVNGRPTQFLLPPPQDPQIQTIAANQPVPADIVARREGFSMEGRTNSIPTISVSSTPQTVNRTERVMNSVIAGIKVRRFLTFNAENNLENIAGAGGDALWLYLWTNMGEDKVPGFATAGVEADNLGTVRLRLQLRKPINGKFAVGAPSCFAGLLADYHTATGYVSRVLFPLAPTGTGVRTNPRPWWGIFYEQIKPPVQVAPLKLMDEMVLDLGRYAPEGWDGRVIFGVNLESSGFGTRLDVQVIGNGPAGPRDPKAFEQQPVIVGSFRGATLYSLEDGTILKDDQIVIPSNGALEATGLRVVTWKVKLAANAMNAGIWINFHLTTGAYQLVKLPLDSGPLAGKALPGTESQFDMDLGQFAPKDWDDRVRIRLVGDGVSARIVDNSAFQIY